MMPVPGCANMDRQDVLDFKREIRGLYRQIRAEVEERLIAFRGVWERGIEEELFCELLFCLLTPAARAHSAWHALQSLKRKGLILREVPESLDQKSRRQRIADELRIVRFKNNKARNVLEAEKLFMVDGKASIRASLLRFHSSIEMREWLADTVRGMGYKEASHFLRNIGQDGDIAILDRHILRALQRFGIIERIPESLTRGRYLQIEERMQGLARRLDMPLHHLDLVLWYYETGELFK